VYLNPGVEISGQSITFGPLPEDNFHTPTDDVVAKFLADKIEEIKKASVPEPTDATLPRIENVDSDL